MSDKDDTLVVRQLFHGLYKCDACGTPCYFFVTKDRNSLPPPGYCPCNFPVSVCHDDKFPKPNLKGSRSGKAFGKILRGLVELFRNWRGQQAQETMGEARACRQWQIHLKKPKRKPEENEQIEGLD